MDERDFLTLAQTLVGETTEVAWRSAVSRAYYAAFHVARHLLEGLGFTVPRADRAHSYLWLRLANCGEPQVQQAGNDLNLLRRDRNEADYNLTRPLRQAAAQNQVQAAQRIIQVFDAATVEPTRTQITDEMKRYERDVLHDVTWHP
jgi:uncharacterized protein (UPF0332 family)